MVDDYNGALCLFLLVAAWVFVILCPVAMAWVGMIP